MVISISHMNFITTTFTTWLPHRHLQLRPDGLLVLSKRIWIQHRWLRPPTGKRVRTKTVRRVPASLLITALQRKRKQGSSLDKKKFPNSIRLFKKKKFPYLQDYFYSLSIGRVGKGFWKSTLSGCLCSWRTCFAFAVERVPRSSLVPKSTCQMA